MPNPADPDVNDVNDSDDLADEAVSHLRESLSGRSPERFGTPDPSALDTVEIEQTLCQPGPEADVKFSHQVIADVDIECFLGLT